MDVLIILPSVILTDSSMGSPVHVLMLSIKAVRGLPQLKTTLQTVKSQLSQSTPVHHNHHIVNKGERSV